MRKGTQVWWTLTQSNVQDLAAAVQEAIIILSCDCKKGHFKNKCAEHLLIETCKGVDQNVEVLKLLLLSFFGYTVKLV